jgi:hypothetical protein
MGPFDSNKKTAGAGSTSYRVWGPAAQNAALAYAAWIGDSVEAPYVRPSKNAFSLRERDGWRSLRSAFASI